jgi:Leucine Rich repeat
MQMEKRNLKSTGFPDTDREILQRAFNEEFSLKIDEERAKLKERRRRAAQQAGLQRRRMLMEQSLQEEQDALAENHQVSMMIELIKENHQVSQSIRIDVNSVTARSLAKAMCLNSTITCLELSSNNLNDHAGSYIARILTRNKTLKKLELDNNNLGPKSLLAFGESLKINTTLVSLSLDSNPIFVSPIDDLKGIRALSDALKSNHSLTSLNLWRTGVKVHDGELLASSLDFNRTILFLDIGHNYVKMKDAKRIADKLDSNLAAFEASERVRREEALTEEERETRIQDKKDVRSMHSHCALEAFKSLLMQLIMPNFICFLHLILF